MISQRIKDLLSPENDINGEYEKSNSQKQPKNGGIKTKLASSEHASSLFRLYEYLRPYTEKTYVGPNSFDLFTIHNNAAFLWEVKSINTSNQNENEQIRAALGQLIEYHFLIQKKAEFQKIKNSVAKGILLSQKPQMLINGRGADTQNYFKFLEEKYNVSIYWLEENRLNGSDSAMCKLKAILA